MSDNYDYKDTDKSKRAEMEARKKADTEESRQMAKLVTNRWNDGDNFLRTARKDFQINLAFYNDLQWVTWNAYRGCVEGLPARFSETERIRMTDNKIAPAIDTLVGILAERDLVFEGDPTDADDQSMKGSQLAESILEAGRQTQGWENIRKDEILGLLLGGTSAVALEWDTSGGERLWVNEQNQQVIGTGEVSLTALTIDEFTLEPGSRSAEKANWWVGLTAVPCAQARDHYGLDWTPEADVSTESNNSLFPSFRARFGDNTDTCAVYVMYERPNRKCKEGRCIAVVNGIVVKKGDWKFPFNNLNLHTFREGQLPGTWIGKTFTTSARPLQVALNAARSNIQEHMKLAGNARMMVPFGSIEDVDTLTDEPGEVVQWHAEPGVTAKPDYLVPPPLSNSIIQYAEVLQDAIADIMHVHDVTRGVAPGDRNSGLALSILAEKNNTPLGPLAHEQAERWGNIATQILKLYAKNVEESREAIVVGKSGVPQKWSWSGKDLRGQTGVRVPIDAVAPYTRAQMLAQLQNLQMLNPTALGMIPPERIIRLTGLSSNREMTNGLAPDIAKAQRENDRMSGAEPQIPEPFDDHAKHIAEHNAFRKTTVYEFATDDVKEIIDAHILAHETLAQEELMSQATMNSIAPGLGALPQGNDPMGSAVPEPFANGPQLNEGQPLPPGPPQ